LQIRFGRKELLKNRFKQRHDTTKLILICLRNLFFSEVQKKQSTLTQLLPILKEKNKNVISKPKITFIDGIENCKNAYLEILKVQDKFLEFWAHDDLESAFGSQFMDEFINQRVQQNIFCDSVGTSWITEEILQLKDAEQLRRLEIFSGVGSISSSIAIYDNKVLILNLKQVYTWVLIESFDFTETMKTIFRICKS